MEPHIPEEILVLITRVLSDEAVELDYQMLIKWVEESEDHIRLYQQARNLFELAGAEQVCSQLSLSHGLSCIMNRISKRPRERKFLLVLQRAAAILLIPLLAVTWWITLSLDNGTVNRQTGVIFNEVFTSSGTRTAVTLSDGTRVWLNSGAVLKYPDSFANGVRQVELKGEAYFEVNANHHNPFIVQTPDLIVQATGTQFNLFSSADERTEQVTLVEGKVVVFSHLDNRGKKRLAQLSPGEHLAVDTLTSAIEISSGDPYRYYAWKDGKLIFRNEPMAEVVKKISSFYNVDIELKGESLKDYRYRATFQEESFSEILNLLTLSSPLEYREIERNPLPDGTFPRRKVVVFARGEYH